MSDDELGQKLRSRIPKPKPGYWVQIDDRLATADPADKSAAASDSGPTSKRLAGMDNTTSLNSNGRLLLAAAAIVAVLGLGALLFSNGDDGVQVDVAAEDATSTTPEPAATTGTGGTALPGVVLVNGEAPLQALQGRLAGQVPGAGEEGAGAAGPFCFESDVAAILAGDDVLRLRSIVWLDISLDGAINAFAYQPTGGPALISGSGQGTDSGMFEMRFAIESGGAGELPPYAVALNDGSISLGGNGLFTAVSCAAIDGEVQEMFSVLNPGFAVAEEVPEGVEFLPDEAPEVWRFKSGPVNYRAQPGLQGEIIGEWAGNEVGILGTGKRARADGYDWVQFAAGVERAPGWVAIDFIEPDPDVIGRLCYRTGQTAMVLDFSEDAESFVGGIRSDVPEGVEYVAVAGRRFEGTLFDVRAQTVGSQLVNTQEWGAFTDGISGNLGLLAITECAAMPDTVTEITANVTAYPALPT